MVNSNTNYIRRYFIFLKSNSLFCVLFCFSTNLLFCLYCCTLLQLNMYISYIQQCAAYNSFTANVHTTKCLYFLIHVIFMICTSCIFCKSIHLFVWLLYLCIKHRFVLREPLQSHLLFPVECICFSLEYTYA